MRTRNVCRPVPSTRNTRTRTDRRIRVEQLEDRTVPTLDWVGGNADWSADVNNWFDTSTSTNHFPGPSDDVRITNGTTVTHNANADTVNSITINGGSKLNLTGGSIADTTDLTVTGAGSAFNLQGGTLTGATVVAGSTLTLTTSGGTLGGVSIAGTLDLSTNFGAYSYVTGGMTVNGTVNIGSVGASPTFGVLYFYYSGSQTIAGTGTINFGDSASNGIHFYSAIATDQLITSPSISIRGANGTISGGSTHGVDIKGTVTADPTTVGSTLTNANINISGVGWLNEGTIQALNGGTITTGGTWSNAGTLTETNSTINLGGTFTLTALGTLTRTGGDVNLTGTLINTGNTLTLNATTGSWNMRGGTVDGGTIAASGGSALIGTNYAGTLKGVTLDGTGGNASPLNMSTISGAFVYLADGLSLNNATINLGTVGASPTYAYLYFYYDGSQTLGGTGTINFGDSSSNAVYFNDYLSMSLLTVAPGVLIRGANGSFNGNHVIDFKGTVTADPTTVGSALTNTTLNISGTNWVNSGTIQALNGGAFTTGGTWSNAGTLTETNSTINLGGTFTLTALGTLTRTGGNINLTGTLVNTGNTLSLTATTGSWNLRGGTVQGGSIAATSGVALNGTVYGGYLYGVTLDGSAGNVSPLDLSSVSGTYVYIYDGLTLDDATINLGTVGASPTYGYLYFYYDGSQTLGGNGTVNFGDSTSNAIYYYDYASTSTLTVEPGITIRGANGQISGNATLNLQGTLIADPTTVGSTLTNTTLTINETNWSNVGTIQVSNTGRILGVGAVTNLSAGTFTGGTWKVIGNSILRLIGVNIATNAASITLDGAGAGFFNDYGSASALATLASNAAAGSLTIRNGFNFVSNGPFFNAGAVTIDSGSQFSQGSQFAASVIAFSSQYSTGSWSAAQTLGPSNTFTYGDSTTAWAPSSQNGTSEFLTLGFATPDYADGVVIRETWGNGFVTQVDVIDTDDNVYTVWTGTDPSQPGSPVNFFASWPRTDYLVKAAKIYVNTNHNLTTWEEIDSVQLVGSLNDYIQTGGTTTVNGTLISPDLVDVQGGLLQGNGMIDGDVLNSAHVSAGAGGAGTLTVAGNYSQTAAGTLDVDIGGLTVNSQYDQLVVNGNVDLDGAIDIAFFGGFLPVVGDQFLIFNNAGTNPIAGDLGHGEGSTFLVDGGARKFHITYQGTDLGGTGNDIVLSTSNISPTLDSIPDPAPILENAGLQTINLTGISAGGTESQALTVTATSSNPAVVPNPTVSYTSPNSTGSISYAPTANMSGVTFITVKVQDDAGTAHGGVDFIERTFRVEVGFVNHAPTFTKGGDQALLEDAGPQTVNAWATNMSPGPPEDAGQNLTFLVSTDNDGLFATLPAIDAITGNLTYTPAANANGSATVTVFLKDDGGTANDGIDTSDPQTFTISVTAINDAPSFAKGGNQSIAEDDGPQTVSGWATSISAGPANESGQILTFQLTTNNDALFSVLPAIDPITGNLIYTPAANANGSATVTVTLKDNAGTANGGDDDFSETFTIAISSVNDQPVLDKTGTPMLPYTPTLGKVLPAGGLVANLTEFITDADAGALKGIAVVGADTAKGQWWYNLTGGPTEADWTVMPALTNAQALLLSNDGNTRIRFVPVKGFTGFASLTFKAWDQTKAPLVEGDMDDTSNGADTSFSVDSDRAWIAVGKTKTAVDPDGRTIMKPVLPVYKPTSRVVPLAAVLVKDMIGIAGLEAPSVPVAGLGIALQAADNTGGTWQFQLAKTKAWVDVGTVDPNNALLLRPTDKLRYVPTLAANGPATLMFKTWDQSIGAAGDRVDPNLTPDAFGIDPGSAVLDLIPIMDLSVPAVLNPINPGQTTNDGLIFDDMMSVSRVVGGNLGVAIIGTKGTGTWEYRPAGAITWTPVGKVSTGQALFLNPDTEIRFTALGTALPHTATLSFKAWDKTKFAVGSRGAATGSIVSKQTEILNVAVGNTAPTLTPGGGVTVPPVSSSSTKLSAGTRISTLLAGVAISDTPKSLKGIAIVGVDNTNGKWQYSVSPNVWIDVNVAGFTSAVLLSDTSKIRFVPNSGFGGTATFNFAIWDRTAGQAGDRIDTTAGLNSFSLDAEVATITVTAQ